MKIVWKTFILLILSSFLFYIWFNNFPLGEQRVLADSEFSGSTIAGLEVTSLKDIEIKNKLEMKILDWKQNSIDLTGTNANISIEPEWIHFDIEATINEYRNLSETPWYAFWSGDKTVHIPLQFTMDEDVDNLIDQETHLNKEETLANIILAVGNLSSEPIETVALEHSIFQSERIAYDLEKVNMNTQGLNEIVSTLNESVIESGKVFSLLEHLQDIQSQVNQESADFVASMIYSVLLQTNYEILERHSQGNVPPYLEEGIEATIHQNTKKDLKFMNINKAAATLNLSIKDSSLLVEIYSIPPDTVASYRLSDRVEIKPRTIYRYSPDLKIGQEELVQEGKAGLRVSVYRTISEKEGPFENETLISQDYYPPVNRVVLKSSVQPENIPTTDPDLAIDMNGDGLPDMQTGKNSIGEATTGVLTTPTTPTEIISNPISGNNESNSESTTETEVVSDELPSGSYYDKAGNIITPKSE